MSIALRHRPDIQEFLRQGRECLRRRDHRAALGHFMRALAEQPHDLEAHSGCGRALGQLGRHEDAAQCFARALTISPGHVDSLNNHGVALHKLGRNAAALACFERALRLAPASADALTNRGFVLQAEGRLDEALASLDAALQVKPGAVTAMHARAMTLERLGAYERALEQLDAVSAIDPGYLDAWNGRGVLLGRLGRTDEAHASFQRALALAPGNLQVLFNLSFLQLAEGELLSGFRGQTLRWTAMLPRLEPGTDRPIWLGQPPLAGKTLLLHHEQGFGDTLQFVRYVPLLATQASRVLLRVPETLSVLLSTLEGGVQVFCGRDPLPPHDLHCPITCLPAALGTTLETIPAPRAYLRAQPQDSREWAQRLGRRVRPRIGLAWRGQAQFALRAERDIPVKLLAPLTRLPADLVSLQTQVPPDDQEQLASLAQIVGYGEQLNNFADTAALIDNLDLVISVDTAVAHLAGALGKPVWILNRHVPCWRWLRDREDSPWYPTARLFRQAVAGDWAAVIEQVHAVAQEWCWQSPPASGA